MRVILFFLAIGAVVYGLFWYAQQKGYIGTIGSEEDCIPTEPNENDEEYSYSYGDRLKDAAGGCL